jgi:hypothetical protein
VVQCPELNPRGLPEVDIEQVQGAGHNAQFTNYAHAFIKLQFPGFRIHSQGAGKAYCSAISAVDALIVLKVDAFIKRLANYIVIGKVLYSLLNVLLFTLKLQEKTSPFSREDFCLQDVDTDVVVPHQMIAEGFVAALRREI